MTAPRRSGRQGAGSAPKKFDHSVYEGYRKEASRRQDDLDSPTMGLFNMRKKEPVGAAGRPSDPNDRFKAETLLIYDWPRPRPRDFTKLSSHHRRWKEKQDQVEGESDAMLNRDLEYDFGDWQDFAGNPAHYNQYNNFEYAVASSFVVRAKRAYRNGQTWEAFVNTELHEDSEYTARVQALRNPEKKEVIMEEALNNTVRLEIFAMIASRLCNEVWLQAFEGVPQLDNFLQDVAAATADEEKRDSAMSDNYGKSDGSNKSRTGESSDKIKTTKPINGLDFKDVDRPGNSGQAAAEGKLSVDTRVQEFDKDST